MTEVDVGDAPKSPTGVAAAEPGRPVLFTLARRVVSALFVVLMCARFASPTWDELFQWHPLGMTLAFAGAMPELLHLARSLGRAKSVGDRTAGRNLHVGWSLLMHTACVVGYAAVFINKEKRGKKHCQSWHGLIGTLTVAACTAQVVAGAAIYWRFMPDKLATMWKFHRNAAIAVVALGAVSMFLGFQSFHAQAHVTALALRQLCAVLPAAFLAVAYYVE